MTPRFGQPARPDTRYRRRPGAYAVLWRDGRVLLTHQDAPEPEFQLPGGGIDPGESPLRALHREVWEETGWSIAGARLIGSYHRFCYMPDYGFHAEKRCMIWLARPVLRLSAPAEPGHSAHWFAPDAALSRLADPGSRHMLRRVLGDWLPTGPGTRRGRRLT
ncbi:MAG: NUDIX domain-containing protein [Paracoccus sp. (in: a-proteobacteria)]|uniref:NUDIX domain-containing protein n=1 Tax=Paracoccus sp. TaxID=267 RepID=UPI00391BBD7A